MFKTVADVDWENWNPVERASLLFVVQGEQILLIHKKRGVGKGKINGPGGKLEPQETPLECAVRETQEELCITPTGVEYAGELQFQFINGYSLHGFVYTATGFVGTPTETDEAIPLWNDLNNLPYDRMWEDNHTWFPHMLVGNCFSGRYIIDEDKMLDAIIELT